MDFPPPHQILYECLNDRETARVWQAYKARHSSVGEFEEVDAAVLHSMDDFAKWFVQWMSLLPSRQGTRIRVLLIWHAHFLSLACQQMLRRSLEQRSFRCRVWFHVEEPTLPAALISRCVVRHMPSYEHTPTIVGPLPDSSLWNDPRSYEKEIHLSEP